VPPSAVEGAPSVNVTGALPVLVIVTGMDVLEYPSCTCPKPATDGDTLSDPPCGVTFNGTLTVA
jgi:hypothetical protein